MRSPQPLLKTSRRSFLRRSITGAASVAAWQALPILEALEPKRWEFEPNQNIIPAPDNPSEWPAFRERLSHWREATRQRLNYNDALYRKPEFTWASSSFACCFLMMCDETFYDQRGGAYTLDEFLDHGVREFGGYDSLVLWHAYPRIGVDQRNQFDFYRDMPGGLKGLRDLSRRCHQRQVRVFIDYNPWDTGTRRERKKDLEMLADMVAAIEADGIFLDTMDKGAAEFRGLLDGVRPGVILEGEDALPLESIHDHHASWAQWFADGEVPGVLRNKWFERRHIQHQIRRWDYDHTGELHAAWMNGSGMMVWENVFGAWVPWSQRDRSILRAMLPIQRRYARLFSGENWTPLVPTSQPGIFASLWEAHGLRLWTLVNRRNEPVSGQLLEIDSLPGEAISPLHYDLIQGEELWPKALKRGLRVDGSLPARGIGCILSGEAAQLGGDFPAFLRHQRQINARAEFDASTPCRETRAIAVVSTARPKQPPAGMVEVPSGTLELAIEMRQRECGYYVSAPPGGHRLNDCYRFNTVTFRRRMEFKRFAIDLTPVTNQEFSEFLKVAKWKPKFPQNFLKHWISGKPPVGQEDHPVVYVDLDDARAYARWAGKRLPTEEEWQYAAQGTDGRSYPWGDELQPGRCNDGRSGQTTPVRAFPSGRSPFGCYDFCGNVWQWTESERTDGRTRFCIIRGGSFFSASGSNWYVDGGPRPANFATKFLLMWAGLDRCATVGFRCARDLG